jgi:hypothetical protein
VTYFRETYGNFETGTNLVVTPVLTHTRHAVEAESTGIPPPQGEDRMLAA